MSDMNIIAKSRIKSSKGAARQLRREGFVPAVVYGAGKEADMVSVDGHSLMLALKQKGFFTNPQNLEVDGKVQKVLPREMQRDVVYDNVTHVDFLRFDASRKLKVMVKVSVTGAEESVGVKKGGVVSLVRNEIELLCRADSIPDELVVDISELDVGDSAHFSSITLPEGVEPTISDRDFTVATVLVTRTAAMIEDEEADAAAAAEASEDGAEGTADAAEGAEESSSDDS